MQDDNILFYIPYALVHFKQFIFNMKTVYWLSVLFSSNIHEIKYEKNSVCTYTAKNVLRRIQADRVI